MSLVFKLFPLTIIQVIIREYPRQESNLHQLA
jgi:hypothetical protein